LVVNIEISGPFEERLRRLVELGVYASAAEAVRDALRRLMNELELRKIALSIYTMKGSSLMYFCEFSEEPCPSAIEFMLVNEVAPRLGAETREDTEPPPQGAQLVLDPSAVLVAYSSLGVKAYEALSGVYEFAVPEPLAGFERVYYARLARLGVRAQFNPHRVQVRVPRQQPEATITPLEAAIVKYSASTGNYLVVDDGYTREYARRAGARVTTTAALLRAAASQGLLGPGEAVEILFSLKSVPYLVPVWLEEELAGHGV